MVALLGCCHCSSQGLPPTQATADRQPLKLPTDLETQHSALTCCAFKTLSRPAWPCGGGCQSFLRLLDAIRPPVRAFAVRGAARGRCKKER